MLLLYNVCFTLFPIAVQSVSEMDIDENILMKNPVLLKQLMQRHHPNFWSLLFRLLFGALHSAILIYSSVILQKHSIFSNDGKPQCFYTTGFVYFAVIMVVTNVDLLLRNFKWTYLLGVAFLLGFVMVVSLAWFGNNSSSYDLMLVGVV